MEEFITEDIKTLIKHINSICIKRNLPYLTSVRYDLITHIDKGEIELKYDYYLCNRGEEEDNIIISSSLMVPFDQYLDEKEKIIYWSNQQLYQEILTHTTFEPELNNINDKYKWN
jgi:hypothetical protein